MACTVAEVSRQAFHDWRARRAAGPTVAEVAEAELVAVMRAIHAESDSTYGEPRMTEELVRRGRAVNHKRVRRLMRLHGIVGVFKPAKVRTTIPAEDNPPIADLVGRRFAPAAPDVVWCVDITYVATGEGWLYVASVLDVGSRRLVGYSMAGHMRTELVADALEMAAATRGGQTAGIIFHGDRGTQGEIKRSSQHLDREVVRDDEQTSAPDCRSGDAWEDLVSGSAINSAARGSGEVLGGDRARVFERRRGGRGRCVIRGWGTMVPSRWRDATTRVGPGVGPLPVVR
jgi:hypothetical protein